MTEGAFAKFTHYDTKVISFQTITHQTHQDCYDLRTYLLTYSMEQSLS